jgi:hypothetical protein
MTIIKHISTILFKISIVLPVAFVLLWHLTIKIDDCVDVDFVKVVVLKASLNDLMAGILKKLIKII